MEPVLASHRRACFDSGRLDLVGSLWLEQAKLCRQSGQHEAAQVCLLEARHAGIEPVRIAIERTKSLWGSDTAKQHRALGELENAVKSASML